MRNNTLINKPSPYRNIDPENKTLNDGIPQSALRIISNILGIHAKINIGPKRTFGK
jgi:hypothetical protein